jgi:hypothetical protein
MIHLMAFIALLLQEEMVLLDRKIQQWEVQLHNPNPEIDPDEIRGMILRASAPRRAMEKGAPFRVLIEPNLSPYFVWWQD